MSSASGAGDGRRRGASWLAIAALLCGLGGAWYVLQEPRNDRDWWPEASVLPRIEIDGDIATIEGFRNFRWFEGGGREARWETRRFDLRKLDAVELMVEPLGDWNLVAHTMLGFGFGDDGRLVVSIEARKEIGEDYGVIAGALRQFELIYLFLDERDALVLRAVQRRARLYAYPVDASAESMRRLFVDLAATANALRDEPRFYRSVFDNCTSAWVRHVDRQLEDPIGMRFETLFPARTGRLLYDTGFMKTAGSFEDAERRFRIDARVRDARDAPDFSERIRRTVPLPTAAAQEETR